MSTSDVESQPLSEALEARGRPLPPGWKGRARDALDTVARERAEDPEGRDALIAQLRSRAA